MFRPNSRLFLTLAAVLATTAAPAAQAQRPAQTRGVPIDLVCEPQATLTPPDQTIRIVGGTEPAKALFAAGDIVLVNAGASRGVEAGQHYFVRRVVEDHNTVREAPAAEKAPLSIHTAGWVTITEVRGEVSIARVSEACDGVIEGDYLEVLRVPEVAAALPAGEPDYEHPARVVLADDRRQLGAGGGSLMVIDRGSDHGLKPGQRLTIFRRTLDGTGPILAIGEAFVATTRTDSSVMRIETSREAIQVGDLIAIHR